MILIISSPEDLSTDFIIDWLNFYKKEFIRINFIDLINPLKPLKIRYSIDENCLFIGDSTLDLGKINAVWFRKLGLFKKSAFYKLGLSNHIEEEILTQLINEYTAFFSSVLQNIDNCYWVTDIKTRGLNKWQVLKYAKEAGLKVPKTDIINNADDLTTLVKERSSITKTLKEPFFFNDINYIYSMYTKIVAEEDIEDFSSFFFPSLIQEKIEKEIEIRTFFIEDDFYSMAIFSQADSQTIVDFRDYNFVKFNRNVPYNLPQALEDKLKILVNKIGLNCGSIDMILDKQGNYIFLEVNPNGQFGMVDFPCNYNLHKLMAENLITKSDEKKQRQVS